MGSLILFKRTYHMLFDTWAKKWKIPVAALAELKDMTGQSMPHTIGIDRKIVNEQDASNAIRREASKTQNELLWRNNVGAYQTDEGGFVRYGLANDSKQINQRIKSSDLIGLQQVRITPDMVGSVIAQFASREVKKPGWKYSGSAHERAQLAWIELILFLGGDACFITTENTE